jgi:viroplasmin and RNaseH domain-containing protein
MESLRPGRKMAGIFKTWKGRKQESLRPGREKTGIFKTWKENGRNL